MLRKTCCLLLVWTGFWWLACSRPARPVKPQYDRPLPVGAQALRWLAPQDWPDVQTAWQQRDEHLLQALERSLAWFAKPSTRQHFPVCHIGHLQAHLSVYAFWHLLRTAKSAQTFAQSLHQEFDCYTSVGWNNQGVVLYTGYYSPVFQGSRQRTAIYRFPLYQRPPDLVTAPLTGKPLGRRVNGALVPYPTRRMIETQGLLKGLELVYLAEKLDAYIIQVQGSAKIELTDGSIMYVGYAGKTDQPYVGLGQIMVARGLIPKEQLSLATIRAYFQAHPQELDEMLYQNKSYVFFKEYDGRNWPCGSLGLKVTPLRTLATDKHIFPRGGVVLVTTRLGPPGKQRPINTFMLDQDTGGAIRSAGRADIYMGIGPQAQAQAGCQYAEGRLYYFFLQPRRMLHWVRKFHAEQRGH